MKKKLYHVIIPATFAAALPAFLLGRVAASGSLSILAAAAVLGTGMSALVFYYVVRHVSRDLDRMRHWLRMLGSGSIDVPLPSFELEDFHRLTGQVAEVAAEIKRSHRQYTNAINYLHAIPTPVHVVDTEMHVQFINRAGARAARRAVGDCIGSKCHDLFHTHDCNSDECKMVRALVQDKVLTGENMMVTRKGEVPFRYTCAPIKDHDGKIIGGIEYVVDIRDEMRVAEMAEEISRGNYDILITPRSDDDRLSHALNAMASRLQQLHDSMARENWLNENASSVNDRLHGEHTIDTLAHNILEGLAEVVDAQVAAFYLARDKTSMQLIQTFGADKNIQTRANVAENEGLIGRAVQAGKSIVLNDLPPDYLTISSGLGETRAASVAILPVYFENTLLGVIELGSFHSLDQKATDFLEKMMENIGTAIHTTQARNQLQELLLTTQAQSEELQVQHEELQQTNEELQEQTNALSASEEKLQAQQEELRVVNEELEERSNALEIKNRDLDQARHDLETKAAALETSGKYKSEFLANMSHELRTPLNSILILSQLLATNKEKNLTGKQVEFADTIHRSGADLLELINQVLDLSKIEAGRMELNPELVEVKSLIQGLTRPFQQIAEEKGIELRVRFAAEVPDSILTDDVRIRQILKNLLSNAFKFTEQGGVTVTVGTAGSEVPRPPHLAADTPCLYFQVTDTGPGIAQDKLQVIFEAFKQADGSTSRKYGGTGLGLSISRELAHLLGGALTVTSESGKGSVFTLCLPGKIATGTAPPAKPAAKQETRPHPALRAPAVTPDSKEPVTATTIRDDRRSLVPGGKSLLIIEDDSNFSSLLLDQAREKGFKGLIAEDGKTGLQLADYYHPSAIILDKGLPGISGTEVMERLKNNPETRHIPVHFISASDQTVDVLQMGAIGYLTKPVSMEKLDAVFDRIERIIDTTVKRLLVIEDDTVQRLAIKALIGNGDVTTVEAESGAEALRQLHAHHFDCIILDLGLADMSGFDLLTKIRDDEQLSTIPVVIYTGKEISRDEEEKLSRYADSIIIKGARSPERLLDETTLFLHRVEKNLPREKQAMLQSLHSRESTFHGRTILLVDDDMRNIFALSSVLEEKEVDIIVAKNGKEALVKLEENQEKIDLVLMDIMMPEMDGFEATRRIRLNPRHRNLPIIALTAKAMKGDRDKCLQAGANDYLAKPVDPERLLSLLRVWLYR